MDEYSKEIWDLQAQIERMVEAEEDSDTIADLSMQLDILRALYARARELYDAGCRDPDLRSGLALRGYGDWSLDNVYAFVYETSVDLPNDVQGSFLGEIRDTNFASLLTH
jgi:hypothetical protein